MFGQKKFIFGLWRILFLLLGFLVLISNTAQATPSGYTYYKDITISGYASTVTNYQVLIQLTGSNFNFSRIQSDCDDIRFTTSDGTDLDFWIERCNTSGSDVAIWVEVPQIDGSHNVIKMYYGNDAATSGANGNNTFIFFDDFAGSVDDAKWTNNSVGYSASFAFDDGNGTAAYFNNGLDSITSISTISDTSVVVEAKSEIWVSGATAFSPLGLIVSSSDLVGFDGYYTTSSTWTGRTKNDTTYGSTTSVHAELTTYLFQIKRSGTSFTLESKAYSIPRTEAALVNETVTNTLGSAPNVIVGPRLGAAANAAYSNYTDWVIVRKFHNSDFGINSSNFSFGSETVANTAPDTPTITSDSQSDGSTITDTTPTLSFSDQDDDDDNLTYQIQIDDDSDFSSVIVDYTSGSAAEGSKSFTVGQAAGSGSYATGDASTVLTGDGYYWRVRSSDGSETSSWATANSGSVAFYMNVNPTITLSVSDSGSISTENGGFVTITATASAVNGVSTGVNFSFSGTATLTNDYTRSGTSCTISAGSSTCTITITSVHDVLDEPDETVIVDISSVTNGSENGTQQVTATIADDDATPTLSVNDPITVTEGTDLSFTVTLSGTSASTVTVDYATANGTATAGSDYTSASGTLSFASGETTKTVTITTSNDSLDEEDEETFTIGLSNASNATISDSSGTGTIEDDDNKPQVSISGSSTTVSESVGSVTVTVGLSTASGRDVIVPISTGAQTTATGGGTDYTFTPTSVTITAGQTSTTATVTIVDDSEVESLEKVEIQISTSSQATLGNDSYLISITDNDSYGLTVTETSGSTTVTEGSGSGDSFTVKLGSEPSNNVTVTLTSGEDCTVSPSTLTFTNGNFSVAQTVTVTAVDDDYAESSHSCAVSFATESDDNNYDELAVSVLTVAVVDNDSVGVSVTESSGSTAVTEGGSYDTITVVLTSEPTSDVTITTSSTGSQLSVLPSTYQSGGSTALIFNSSNWDEPQTLNIRALDDDASEGNHSSVLSFAVTSGDSGYNGLSVSSLTVPITDNDSVGVTITESVDEIPTGLDAGIPVSGTSVRGTRVRAQQGDTYYVVLTSRPSSTVTINVSANNSEGVSVDSTTLTFRPARWNISQTVSVSMVSGASKGRSTITHTATSDDSSYNGLSVSSVLVSLDQLTTSSTTSGTSGTSNTGHSNGTPPTVTIAASPRTLTAGQNGTLTAVVDGSGSFTYQWTQTAGTTASMSDTSSRILRITAPTISSSQETLTFSLTVTGSGSTSVTKTVSIYVLGQSIQLPGSGTSSGSGSGSSTSPETQKVSGQIIGVSNDGQVIKKSQVSPRNGITYEMLDLGNGRKVYGAVGSVSMVTHGDYLVVSDYQYQNYRGVVLIIRLSEWRGKIINIYEDDISNIAGVDAITGLRIGDALGYKVAFGNIICESCDNIAIFAPGMNYGGVIIADLLSSEIENVITGSSGEYQIRAKIFGVADLNGDNLDDLVLGMRPHEQVNNSLSSYGGSELIRFTTAEDLETLSAATNNFKGLLSLSQTSEVNFETDAEDFVYEPDFEANIISNGDLNGDGIQDSVLASSESCDMVIYFGSSSLGSTDVVESESIVCSEGDGFSSLNVGDVNGDDFDDLVFGISGKLYILLGREDWSDITTSDALVLENDDDIGGNWLQLIDVDGDGSLDLVTDDKSDSTKSYVIDMGAVFGTSSSSGSNSRVNLGNFAGGNGHGACQLVGIKISFGESSSEKIGFTISMVMMILTLMLSRQRHQKPMN